MFKIITAIIVGGIVAIMGGKLILASDYVMGDDGNVWIDDAFSGQQKQYERELASGEEIRLGQYSGAVFIPTKIINKKSDKVTTKTSQSDSKRNIENKKYTYYFSYYNVGDYRQNDSSPCHGASGPDLCKLAKDGYTNPIAITSDVRRKMGLKRWDKVKLSGPSCDAPGIYTVLDEMGPRFRRGCIKKGGVCIKGDIARPVGKKGGGGVCDIQKL